jgi:hypothetical protein
MAGTLSEQPGFFQLRTSSSPLTVAVLVVVVTYLLYVVFVPPRRLYSNSNNVRVIKSRFGGLGAVGFYANRYSL